MTREEALNILHNASVYHPDYLDALNMAIEALEQEQKWIPVSEKLPMKGTQVLCCNKYGSVFTSHLTWSKGYLMFGQHSDVLAWMPLPEAYKEGGEE